MHLLYPSSRIINSYWSGPSADWGGEFEWVTWWKPFNKNWREWRQDILPLLSLFMKYPSNPPNLFSYICATNWTTLHGSIVSYLQSLAVINQFELRFKVGAMYSRHSWTRLVNGRDSTFWSKLCKGNKTIIFPIHSIVHFVDCYLPLGKRSGKTL